jgi:hypothetical protein
LVKSFSVKIGANSCCKKLASGTPMRKDTIVPTLPKTAF